MHLIGFGDSDNDEDFLLHEMITVFTEVIKTANGFVIIFNGKSERFDASIQQMIRKMEAMFGKEFWGHVIMCVSFWKFDKPSIDSRIHSGKTEEWWTTEMNKELEEKFHTGRKLNAVFIDSWAKKDFNLNDLSQKEAFERETTKLWTLFHVMPDFEFKGIDDVLNDLHKCNE